MHRYNHTRFLGLLLIGFLFLTMRPAFAQAPRTMSFQGLLTNPDGSKLTDGPVSLDITLYDVESGGSAVWTESHQTTVTSGVFSVILGQTTPLSAAFDRPYWVGIKVNGESELVPRIPLTASPYSLGAVATVSEPVSGTNFNVTDSTGAARTTISATGDVWSAGQATFDGGVVVGDSTAVNSTGKTGEIQGNSTGGIISTPTIGVYGWSTAGGVGVKGNSSSGTGVLGTSFTGTGVFGGADNGIGVQGVSINSNGVLGISTEEEGVWGSSTNSHGVHGESRGSAGVWGASVIGDGVYGKTLFGRWAGHFDGSVSVESSLWIGIIPSSTSTSYLVSDGGWVNFTTVAPGGGSFTGVLTDTPLIIKNSAGQDVVTVNPSGTSNQTGHATFGDGIEATSTNNAAVSGVSTNGAGVKGTSSIGTGVSGDSTDNDGVSGLSTNGDGVSGLSTNGMGVVGTAGSSYGVFGKSTSSTGVNGFSITGDGVFGESFSGPWAIHAGTGNVRIENRLKIEDIPQSTSTSYLVSNGGWVNFTTVAPGSGFDGGTIHSDLKMVSPAGDVTFDVSTLGEVSVSGSVTVGKDVTIPTSGGGSVKIDGTGSNTRIGLNNTSGSSIWGVNQDGSSGQVGPWTYDGPTGSDVIIGGSGDDVLNVRDPVTGSVWMVNNDGSSSQSGLGTFHGGWRTDLANGNIARINPDDGFNIRTPGGTYLVHNDPDGNALFAGDVWVDGTLTKGAGSFKIDDPIDPLNKYLSHSFVESPDMMNVYNGNVILDSSGEARIDMPDWFEALNKDFRYQLTAIGSPGPNLYVAREMANNSFGIAGGESGMKVSWQVTGIRHDPYANKHRIKTEEDKPAGERGKYMHPDSYR